MALKPKPRQRFADDIAERFYIARPTEAGLYESSVLEELVTIRINADGQASAIVEVSSASYETAILDFPYYASEYGPFRRLDAERQLSARRSDAEGPHGRDETGDEADTREPGI